MRNRRMILAVIPAAVVATAVAGPAPVSADPQVGGCVNAVGVSACTNVGIPVPNINAIANAIPNIGVPNINVPHINVPHGHL